MINNNNLYSFGALLKSFRERKKFTQQQLATAIGIHRNTIGRWEQGDFLPENKGIVLEIVQKLHLSNQEGRQLLEASFTAPAPLWNVPYRRNPFFTGRKEYLETLHQYLNVYQINTPPQPYAISGLGGFGKTQLVIEYSYSYALEYSAILWIRAENVENIITSFLNIAELLHLPEHQNEDQQYIVAAVQNWLMTHDQWLLIWDNLENMELLTHYLPTVYKGAVLITTRYQILGNIALGLELPPMAQEEGMLFLLRRAKVLNLQDTYEQEHLLAQHRIAAELVTAVGGLPLALDQIGAYIEETGCDFTTYLHLYTQHSSQLLERRGTSTEDHPQSVMVTLSLTYQRVEQANQAAADLLCLCAFLHPDAISEEFLEKGSAELGPILHSIINDPYQFNQTIAVLRHFSLIRRHFGTRMLSIHRLVQKFIRESLDPATARQWVERMVRAQNAVFPPGEPIENWPTCQRYLAQVEICASFIKRWQLVSPESGRLLHEAGVYLRKRAFYAQAEQLLEQAQAIRQQVLGPEHTDVAESFNELAVLCRALGRYEEARKYYFQALHIRERHLGPEHPKTAESFNDLALLYWYWKKFEDAEPLFLHALYIWEQHNPEHPHMASVLSNLALLYWSWEKYEQAEPLFLRAVHIWEQWLGPEHPETAIGLNNLARLYMDQGQYEQAEPLFLRAVHIWEQQLGPEHPQTAVGFNSLARLYTHQDKHEQAEALFLKALAIRKQRLGPEHPSVATTLSCLAKLYASLRRNEDVESLLLKALTIREQQLGLENPAVAESLNDLAVFYTSQGRYEDAKSLLLRASRMREHYQKLEQPHKCSMLVKSRTC